MPLDEPASWLVKKLLVRARAHTLESFVRYYSPCKDMIPVAVERDRTQGFTGERAQPMEVEKKHCLSERLAELVRNQKAGALVLRMMKSSLTSDLPLHTMRAWALWSWPRKEEHDWK